MMNLKPNLILRTREPAFGAARAPNQWHDSAHRSMKDLSFETHILEQCLFLPYRRASREEAMTFEYQRANYKLDGIAGLHVDDLLAAGEGVTCKEDIQENHEVDPTSCRERSSSLVCRYRFGTLYFAENITFCGAEIFQSRDRG